MRFTCEKNMLVSGLNVTGRVVAQKSTMSALEGILCVAGDGIHLTGYNMETAITCSIEAEVHESGRCVFPKLFGDIIRRMPEGMVTVSVDEKYQVSIRAGYSAFTISAETADEYPEIPDVNEGHSISIPQKGMKELISGTIFAVADENQGRPIHTGVKFEVADDMVSCIAVDGYRLARRTYHLDDPTGRTVNFVVPAAALKEVEKILSDEEGEIAFTPGQKHILFHVGTVTLICRLLEGDFLDWRKVVPTNSPVKLTANVSDLARAVERVGLIVSEKYKSPVRCLFTKQEVELRAKTTVGEAQDRCILAGDGQELEIGFNGRYLADALRAIPGEEVVMELTNSISPIVMTPAESKYDYSYMVLPVRIKTN